MQTATYRIRRVRGVSYLYCTIRNNGVTVDEMIDTNIGKLAAWRWKHYPDAKCVQAIGAPSHIVQRSAA